MSKTSSTAAANQETGAETGTETQAPDLFTPLTLGPYELSNRVVMAPLTRNRAGDGDAPTGMNVAYYRQRASAGLIVTEGSQISPRGKGYPGTPGIHSAQQIAGWRKVTDAVHEEGGRIFLQLWHVGRISHPSLQPGGARPVAPSALRPEGEVFTEAGPQPFVTPRALKTEEIPVIVGEFRKAARNAREAGFDGVEVHAANGYLLDQFLRDGTNRRTDRYGGTVENRARLLLEVTRAVIDVWGADRVGVRLSPVNSFNDIADSDPDTTFGYAASELSKLGIAFLHVVESDVAGSTATQSFDKQKLRQAFDGLYLANGGYNKTRATAALADGAANFVSFGAPYVANPDLVERFAQDAPLNEPDPGTFYGGDERGYTDYPRLGDEALAA